MGDLTKRKHGPKHLQGLTDQQANFVREYVGNGGKGAEAAREAGYSFLRADRAAWELTQHPVILAAIRMEQMRRIVGEGATVAISTLLLVANDSGAKGSERVAASRTLLEAAHLIGKTAEANPLEDKALSDMTREELGRFIAREEAALAELKGALPPPTIDVTPGIVPNALPAPDEPEGEPEA